MTIEIATMVRGTQVRRVEYHTYAWVELVEQGWTTHRVDEMEAEESE